MKESVSILKEALLTEKATALSANLNQYIFSVDRKATKRNIKDAVEAAFGVTVLKVNTSILKPKSKRDRMRRNKLGHTAHVKKAIVKLKSGDAIDLA
ncbi:MAG: 50S ribosomal protein L23 [Verrucomicrobiota bacterium]|jgi:large subunit ribosomal protein L23|nr:50S ribosomal protein L23 [Verrucomicrobiota bacterium]